ARCWSSARTGSRWSPSEVLPVKHLERLIAQTLEDNLLPRAHVGAHVGALHAPLLAQLVVAAEHLHRQHAPTVSWLKIKPVDKTVQDAFSMEMPAYQIKNIADEQFTISHRQYSQDTPQPEVEEGVPVGVRLLTVLQSVLLEQRR